MMRKDLKARQGFERAKERQVERDELAAQIVEMRDGKKRTFVKIAQHFGLTGARIQQIYSVAKKKLGRQGVKADLDLLSSRSRNVLHGFAPCHKVPKIEEVSDEGGMREFLEAVSKVDLLQLRNSGHQTVLEINEWTKLMKEKYVPAAGNPA